MKIAALFAFLATTFVVVPLDDRPVTLQLPRIMGAIAGVDVVTPPRSMLGRYLRFGEPDRIARWLRDEAPADAAAYVVSTDMLAYGGLIASRTPATPKFLAFARLRELAAFRASRPRASFAAFGTIMRLAPTGVPALGEGAGFFAAGDAWPRIQQYANLPDPPQTAEQRALTARLREQLGPVLDAYLATRARNREVDLFALQLLAEGSFDRVILGQDDAGPVGLHLRDLAALRAYVAQWHLQNRASIEPGADELAMALLGAALARQAAFVPYIRVVYSRADAASVNDPLEFAPIDGTVGALIRTSGATRVADAASADIDLFVRVAGSSPADERAFIDAIDAGVRAGRLVAVADLTFLAGNDYGQQRALVEAMIERKIAGRIAAFASWNTAANTLGTAIPEAIAVAAGKRMRTYDPLAHAQFMLDRYADDYAFHDFTRPAINNALSAAGITDHTYLLPEVARPTGSQNRSDLWPRALDLLRTIYPEYRDAGLTITLPWDRTFETELDIHLRPH
ncbi:MAG: DUF4127 family protein [Candidatus Velthaea sp.]